MCIDDLEDPEFSDILGGTFEDEHLCEVVDQALVGTEEADAEAIDHDLLGIDAAYDDKGVSGHLMDDEDVVCAEQDLFDDLPLPGKAVKERERKAKWVALPRRARMSIRRLHRNSNIYQSRRWYKFYAPQNVVRGKSMQPRRTAVPSVTHAQSLDAKAVSIQP